MLMQEVACFQSMGTRNCINTVVEVSKAELEEVVPVLSR